MGKILPLILMVFWALGSCPVNSEETLSWKACLDEAKKNHPDLISAIQVVNQEKAGKKIAASGLYPQISATLDASTAKSGSGAEAADTYSYGLNATQLIFDGLKTPNNVNTASADIKAAEEGYKFSSSAVRFNLRSAFIDLLKAQKMIEVAEDIVKIRQDNHDLINLRYQSGLEHKGALLTAGANLKQAKFELSQAKRDIRLSQRKLTKEMGREDFLPVFVEGEFIVGDQVLNRPDFDFLVKNNPALLQAVAKTNSAAFKVRSTYAEFAPQLSGKAGANKSGDHWEPKSDKWNLGLSLSMPIFEGGLRVAQVQQAEAAYKQAQADERSKKDSLIVSLEENWASLQDAVETVAVKRAALDASEERSRIAEAQYSTGFIDFDSWIIIEDDLVKAKKAFLEAEADSLLKEASWIQAKGGTLEYAQ